MKTAVVILVLGLIATVCELRVARRRQEHLTKRKAAGTVAEKLARAITKRTDDDDLYGGNDDSYGDGYGYNEGDDEEVDVYDDGEHWDGDYGEDNSEYYDEEYDPDDEIVEYHYDDDFYTYSEEDLKSGEAEEESGGESGAGGGGAGGAENPESSGGAGNGNCDERKLHHHGKSDTCGLQAAHREYQDLKRRSGKSWAYRNFFRRIVGGKLSLKGEWPWIVSIQMKWAKSDPSTDGHFCGGTLINSCYVLTAAHCFFGKDGSQTTAESIVLDIGESSIKSRSRKSTAKSKTVDAEKVITHPKYNKKTDENDIALIRLARPVKFNKQVCPGCLPPDKKDNMFKPGRTLITAGWGDVKYKGKLSPKLKHVRVSVRDPKRCEEAYGTYGFNKKRSICAGGKRVGHDSCQGDSGGPIMGKVKGGKFAVVGVVSYGDGCANGSPAVYTRIKTYFRWIKANIKDCCNRQQK